MKCLFHLAFFLFAILAIPSQISSQVVYHDIKKSSVYDFLDEMANLQLIDLNTAIKPYSRKLIAEKLSELKSQELNKRQEEELAFFLKDFNVCKGCCCNLK